MLLRGRSGLLWCLACSRVRTWDRAKLGGHLPHGARVVPFGRSAYEVHRVAELLGPALCAACGVSFLYWPTYVITETRPAMTVAEVMVILRSGDSVDAEDYWGRPDPPQIVYRCCSAACDRAAERDDQRGRGPGYSGPCSWCQQPMTSRRGDARTCSTRCRVAAHRASKTTTQASNAHGDRQ